MTNDFIFNMLFQYILEVEGGYTNDKYDRGGETKYGIIKEVASRHGYFVPDLTKEQAKQIYYEDYYIKFKLNYIKSFRMRLSLFDFIVHSGRNAVKKAQETLNELGFKLVVDGIIGIKTVYALNSVSVGAFLNLYHKKQKEYYEAIVNNDNKQAKFIKGWLRRIDTKNAVLQ